MCKRKDSNRIFRQIDLYNKSINYCLLISRNFWECISVSNFSVLLIALRYYLVLWNEWAKTYLPLCWWFDSDYLETNACMIEQLGWFLRIWSWTIDFCKIISSLLAFSFFATIFPEFFQHLLYCFYVGRLIGSYYLIRFGISRISACINS